MTLGASWNWLSGTGRLHISKKIKHEGVIRMDEPRNIPTLDETLMEIECKRYREHWQEFALNFRMSCVV